MSSRPRHFCLKPIYTETTADERIHQAFTAARRDRQRGRVGRISVPMLLSLVVLLLAVALLIIYTNR